METTPQSSPGFSRDLTAPPNIKMDKPIPKRLLRKLESERARGIWAIVSAFRIFSGIHISLEGAPYGFAAFRLKQRPCGTNNIARFQSTWPRDPVLDIPFASERKPSVKFRRNSDS